MGDILVQAGARPQRMMGLGQTPQDFGVGKGADEMEAVRRAMDVNFTQVPVIEFVTWTTTLPLTDLQTTSTFGNSIDLFGNPKTVPGIDAVDSSFVQNGDLQVDMLCLGFGCHIFGEPLSFTIPGNSREPQPASGASSIMSPDVFTQNDLANGVMGATSGIGPASLEWGVADWNAAWHMANGYKFQWLYQQRFLLINELAADVCYFGPYAEALASGTSDVAVQQYVRQTNNRYRTQAGGGIFVPVNARRVGSVTVAGPLNVGIFRPTRDFDQANVTWGGIRNQGATGCCNPFRKLPRPVLLEKGIPIGMSLQASNTYHQQQMQRYLSISEMQGGNIATIAYDANVTGGGGLAGTGVTPVFLEQTSDAVPVNTPQQVQTNRTLYKGGALKVAILIKGFEIWGEWKRYVARYPGVLDTNLSGPGLMR